MGSMLANRFTLLLAGVFLGGAAAAQETFLYNNSAHDFRLRVPKFLKEQPLEPHEEQILAKFTGTAPSTDSFMKGDLELIALVIRINRIKAGTTGKPEDDDKELEKKSVKELSKEQLNAATTVTGFLKRRGFKSDFDVKSKLTKPVKSKNGDVYKVQEITDTHFNENRWQERKYVIIRSFTVESDREIFGLVFLGPGVQPFEKQTIDCAESLERRTIEAVAGKDPYANSSLRDLERRRKVREKLVAGWEAFDTENFIMVTNSKNKKLIDDMLKDLEIMRTEYMKHFPPIAEMTAVSTVRVCANYDDYLGYGAPDGTGGYWSHIDEELVLFEPGKRIPKVRPWLKDVDPVAVMYHEAMHQYLHYSNAQLAPTSWFNEGYGEYFGGAKLDRAKGRIDRIEKNAFRLKWIKLAQKQQAWPDLRVVLRMPQYEFYSGSSLQNYAFAWAFCYFLENERDKTKGRNEQWAAIPETYLKHLREGSEKAKAKMPKDAPKDWITGMTEEIQNQAFEKTFEGVDIPALEKAWIEFMKKL